MASGTVKALDGIDLEINEGERIIPTGSFRLGKDHFAELHFSTGQSSCWYIQVCR